MTKGKAFESCLIGAALIFSGGLLIESYTWLPFLCALCGGLTWLSGMERLCSLWKTDQ